MRVPTSGPFEARVSASVGLAASVGLPASVEPAASIELPASLELAASFGLPASAEPAASVEPPASVELVETTSARLLAREPVYQERRDLARRRTARENPVHPQVARHRLVEARTADDEQRSPVGRIGLAEGRGHLTGVEQVGVALGDDLRDEHGVRLLLAGPLDELGHADLRPEV